MIRAATGLVKLSGALNTPGKARARIRALKIDVDWVWIARTLEDDESDESTVPPIDLLVRRLVRDEKMLYLEDEEDVSILLVA